ncbi:mfs general substrate transporter, partial [Rhizoctonia solani]
MAPALGGFLSHPAERYPSILGYKLFRQYPYLLPCLVGSAFSAIGLIAGVLFLEESLPKNKLSTSNNPERRPLLASPPQAYSRYSVSTIRPVQSSQPPSPDGCGSAANETEKEAPTVKEMMGIPSIRKILISYGFMAYVTVSINAVLVLWLYTPAKSGGVGFSNHAGYADAAFCGLQSAEIGSTLTLSGIFGTIIAVTVFPPLERRVGAVLNVLAFPVGHALALSGGRKGAYLGVAGVLIVRCIASMVFVCNMLLVTRSAPCRRALGTINGLAQMVASASRAIGPATATSLFAFSVKNGSLGGNLVWIVLSLVGLLGVVAACYIPNDRPTHGTEPNP